MLIPLSKETEALEPEGLRSFHGTKVLGWMIK